MSFSSGRGHQASQVAHNWAHKKESSWKKDTVAGSLYYDGDTIYSYGNHFPIAKHVTGKNGEAAVLFTTRSYSNTTAKHISYVRGAVSHMKVIYCTHVPSKYYSVDHHANFGVWVQQIKNIAAYLPKAKKPEKYIQEINSVLEAVRVYSEFFGVKLKAEHKKVFEMPVNGFKKMAEKAAAEIAKREKERAKAEAARIQKEVAEFRAFDANRVDTYDNSAYLRYNSETKRVETSKGIVIPAEAARRFYKWIKTTIESGGCDGNCEMKILDYTVKAVNEKVFTVGCHTIAITEAEAIAKLLNWK